MSTRRVVITGAGGFVGSTLAQGFADRGWTVLGLDRDFDGGPVDARVRTLRVDLEAGLPAAVADRFCRQVDWQVLSSHDSIATETRQVSY